MMRLKWFPWKFIIKYAALKQGFIDPIQLLSRFNRFAQPSEVWAPVELMRAGAILHARGLINSQVIQHNLDWVWPYWVERQFDPLDSSFIPRAFSITHINLTHRNWTAAGIPGIDSLVLVDPRGLVTPFTDSWSIDGWIITENNIEIIPSRTKATSQKITNYNSFSIETETFLNGLELRERVTVVPENGSVNCVIEFIGKITEKGLLIVALRPYNPEGISFINNIELLSRKNGWRIDQHRTVVFDRVPEYTRFSNFHAGDVYHWIHSKATQQKSKIACSIGLATAMAAFPLTPGYSDTIKVIIPICQHNKRNKPVILDKMGIGEIWETAFEKSCKCIFPFKRYQELFDIAMHTLLLHSPDSVYAGPYTYKRFWFRDAAFIIHALLCANIIGRSKRIIDTFFSRQTNKGYFLSQDGEWDSNGQALWTLMRYCTLTGSSPDPEWKTPIIKGAEWICTKRKKHKNKMYNGLFPPGFSAEHLGPNDYYYWDDFWGVAGLNAASSLLEMMGRSHESLYYKKVSQEFVAAISESLKIVAGQSRRPIMPASPNRRPDSGAVGSLVAGYPLEVYERNDSRLMLTAEYLFEHCCINNAFYHDISHSGINPYLTLHIAQTFLRNSDVRFAYLMDAIADLASPTGQWPEAIHPQLFTGCMGDGQHVWAAAEWIMIMRNSFILEDTQKNMILLCAGLTREHITSCKYLSFGPTPTIFGLVRVTVEVGTEYLTVSHVCELGKNQNPDVLIAICGCQPIRVQSSNAITKISFNELDV